MGPRFDREPGLLECRVHGESVAGRAGGVEVDQGRPRPVECVEQTPGQVVGMGQRRGQDEGVPVCHREHGRLGPGVAPVKPVDLAPAVEQHDLHGEVRSQQARDEFEALPQKRRVVAQQQQGRTGRPVPGLEVLPGQTLDRLQAVAAVRGSFDLEGRAAQAADQGHVLRHQPRGDAAGQLHPLCGGCQGERRVIGMIRVARGPFCHGTPRHHHAEAGAPQPVLALGQPLARELQAAGQTGHAQRGSAIEAGRRTQRVQALPERREIHTASGDTG